MNEDLIATVTGARFTPVLRQGYVMGDVDQLLERLVVRLGAGQPVRELIESTRIPVASWSETYERHEVDLLLAQVKHKAEVDPDAPLEPVDEAPPEPAVMHVPQPRTETVVEKKSLFARIFSSQ